MAKVTDPLRSSEARGKVGGTQYNTWRGLHTVRTIGYPTNQDTSPRIEARRKLIYWSAQWRDITQALRDGYDQYANTHPRGDWTGQPVRLTGHQWFVACSIQAERCGVTLNYPPGSYPPPNPLLTFTGAVIPAGNSIEFTWTHDHLLPDFYIDIWDSGTTSAGRNPTIKESKAFYLGPIDVVPYTAIELSSGWHVYHARVISTLNGLTSAWLSLRLEVT